MGVVEVVGGAGVAEVVGVEKEQRNVISRDIINIISR